MDTRDNVTDITKYIKPSDNDCRRNTAVFNRHQTNPILKKEMIISIKNNIHKFSVSDLFD